MRLSKFGSLRFTCCDRCCLAVRRRLGEAVPFPAGAAHIIKEGDIPLSDSDDGDGRQPPRSQPARHPDEELEDEQAAAEQRQQDSDDWEPAAAAADSDEEGLAAAAAALRLSPPPVSAAELASGELEVVSAEEDRRMIELMRQQVCFCYVRMGAVRGLCGSGEGDAGTALWE